MILFGLPDEPEPDARAVEEAGIDPDELGTNEETVDAADTDVGVFDAEVEPDGAWVVGEGDGGDDVGTDDAPLGSAMPLVIVAMDVQSEDGGIG